MRIAKTYMMNTRQLRYALVLAEERSISKTAQKLNVSQPSLTQYINNLEQSLGYKLFNRTIMPLQLTAAGEIYVETARKILDLEKQMDWRLRDMEDQPSGTLSIGMPLYHAQYKLPKALKLFNEKYLYYNIEVVCRMNNDDRLKMLEQGELDFSLSLLPVDEKKFEWIEIFSEELLLAMPVDHPLNDTLTIINEVKPGRHYPLVDLRELKNIPFLMVKGNYGVYRLVNNLFQQLGLYPREIIKCESTEVCHAMVAAGIGTTIIQSIYANYEGFSQKPRYYSIFQDYPIRQLAAVYRKDQYMPRAVLDFIDILKSI